MLSAEEESNLAKSIASLKDESLVHIGIGRCAHLPAIVHAIPASARLRGALSTARPLHQPRINILH